MKKVIVIYVALIIAFLILTSCKSGYPIKNHELTPLKKDFSNTYKDYNLTIDSTSMLLKLFEVDAVNPNRIVNLKMVDEDKLQLTYQNKFNVSESKTFKGKLTNTGFKIFIKKDRCFILPIVWTTDVKRLKLNLTKDKDLVINEYRNTSGMILFIGAGGSSKKQYTYKKVG